MQVKAPNSSSLQLLLIKPIELLSSSDPAGRELVLDHARYWKPLAQRMGPLLTKYAYSPATELDFAKLKQVIIQPTWHIVQWHFTSTTGYIDYALSSTELAQYWTTLNPKHIHRHIIADMRPFWVTGRGHTFAIKFKFEEIAWFQDFWAQLPDNKPLAPGQWSPLQRQRALQQIIPAEDSPRIRFTSKQLYAELKQLTPHVFDADAWNEFLLERIGQAGPLGFIELKTPLRTVQPWTPAHHTTTPLTKKVVSPRQTPHFQAA